MSTVNSLLRAALIVLLAAVALGLLAAQETGDSFAREMMMFIFFKGAAVCAVVAVARLVRRWKDDPLVKAYLRAARSVEDPRRGT